MDSRDRYTPEFRDRAIRMLSERRNEFPSRQAAIAAIAESVGCEPEILRAWADQAGRHEGAVNAGVVSDPGSERLAPWQAKLHEVIYGAETPAGRAFDIALIVLILMSVVVVMVESIRGVSVRWGPLLRTLEWTFTIAFTLEYVLRAICVKRPWSYMKSFFGIVDVLAVLPTYVSLFFPGSQSLVVVRFLRLLRIFRVFKLAEYLREAQMLQDALTSSRRKIAVFFMSVLTLAVIIGAVMYLVEGEQSGFNSIPKSVYWTIVTLTTVGFGDITPRTPLGQLLASIVMLIGYSIIAVPTGIVTAEMTLAQGRAVSARACPSCSHEGHEPDARHCKHCGGML